MATALTPDEIVEAFRHWDILDLVDFEPGWQTRANQGGKGRFSDVAMLVEHHMGDDNPDGVAIRTLRYGHSALPGPLSQFAPKDSGRLHVVAAGPCNHAGKGDPRVLAAVKAESYRDYPPATRYSHTDSGAVGGNAISYGWENTYGGGSDLEINPKQYRISVVSKAAITWALAKKSGDTWTAKSTIGHKEWQRGKIDPRGIDMKVERADIQWCLDNGPAASRRWYDTNEKETEVNIPELVDKVVHGVRTMQIPVLNGEGRTASLQTMIRVTHGEQRAVAGEVAELKAGQEKILEALASRGDIDLSEVVEAGKAALVKRIEEADLTLSEAARDEEAE